MEKKYKSLYLALFLAILVFSFFLSHKPAFAPLVDEQQSKNIKFIGSTSLTTSNGAIINVEVADNPAMREKGLSGRRSLAENSGMLFVFPAADDYSFWMKDMNFGLDFVWIKGDTVMEITPGVMPPGSGPLDVLTPKEKIDKVLEINAGAAERLGIKIGDRIEY